MLTKGDYRPQPVQSPLSGTHFTCCRDIQTGTCRNKETKQRRNKEMLSRVALDHSQSSPLSWTHFACCRDVQTGTYRSQINKETKRCCPMWLQFSASPLSMGHTLPVAGTYRNQRNNQQRNKEMLSKMTTDHSQSPLWDTLCLLQGRTQTKKQTNKETKKCCQG